MPDIFQDAHYDFDGESLLQRLARAARRKLYKIYQSSKHYLLNNYGTVENINVVFDGGYLVPSTKGSKHIRRSKGKLGRKIVSSLHNPLNVKRVDFLLHKHNKQAFLEMFGT